MPVSLLDVRDGGPPALLAFLRDRHLATLATSTATGRIHVVPVGFTWDPTEGIARVITSGTSVKVRNVERLGASARAVLTQLDGRWWLSLEGQARVLRDPLSVRDAERRYAERYRVPRVNPARVVIEIRVDRVMGNPPHE